MTKESVKQSKTTETLSTV